MSHGEWSGIFTALALIAFLGVTAWTYSARRKPDFDAAARLPLDENDRETRP